MNRVWRAVLLLAALCVALGATTATAGAKPKEKPAKAKGGKPGQLDTKFGRGGKVTVAFPAENAGSTGPKYQLPFEFTPGHLEMAQAPGGKVVVAGAQKIVRYLPNGKPDPTFGNGGTVAVPRPPGSVFVLAGVAVDSLGRVVLAGLTRPLPSNSTPDPVLSSAAVMRFNADGSPDTTFGNGGTLITEFGLGAPKAGGGKYPGASVGIRDVVIDSQNRPVLSGGYVTELGECESTVNSKGFIARLTESGQLDPTFGSGGIRTLSEITTFGLLEKSGSGYLTLGSGRPVCKGKNGPYNLLTGFDEEGNLDPNFGSFGFRTLPFDYAPAITVAPSGKILLLGRPERHTLYRKVKKVVKGKKTTVKVRYHIRTQTVQRLLTSGAGDPGFGRVGRINYTDPQSGSFSTLAADPQERIYLAGRIGLRVSKSPHNPLHRTQFLLERAQSNGNLDKTFGKGGSVATGFGGPANAFATQLAFVGGNKVLVGGGIISSELSSGGGFALARYWTGK